jgi:DNA-binding GntR family transcriptional regulator
MAETLSQKAYNHIHKRLVNGVLAPGRRLSNRAVAKEIGISFTPVREALNRLVSEGLLEHREGLGVFVPVPSRKEIEEIYEVREMLECAVVERLAGKTAPAVLAEMRQCNEKLETLIHDLREQGRAPELLEGVRQTDIAFHHALFRGTGNRLLLEMASGIRTICTIKTGGSQAMGGFAGPSLHRFDDVDDESLGQLRRTINEHAKIVDVLKKGDADAAVSIMAEHLRNGCRLALESYDHTYMNRP